MIRLLRGINSTFIVTLAGGCRTVSNLFRLRHKTSSASLSARRCIQKTDRLLFTHVKDTVINVCSFPPVEGVNDSISTMKAETGAVENTVLYDGLK